MTEYDLPAAETLPAAMVTRKQWLCWRAEDRDGKTTKVPVDPSTGSYASTTDPEMWTDFATARKYAETEGIGLGFVFADCDPLVGIDLDHCRDVDSGALADWAEDIIARLDSFTEISPSGTGVHVIVKGELPDGRNRHGDVELYETSRFFTVTGDHLEDTPETVALRTDALAAVHAEYVAQDEEESEPQPTTDTTDRTGTVPPATGSGNDLSDEALLEKARNAKNGDKFDRLYRGSLTEYPSQSEADMALCSLLAFWTGGNAQQMDRLFRDSGLIREKWDEVHFSDGATYGERTIERAISGTDAFYDRDTEWSLFPEKNAEPVPRDDSPDDDSTDSVDIALVERLESEIRRLEDENKQLLAELREERERRETLQRELEEERSTGWLKKIFG
jgi:putative DNA primase/helicase